MDHELLRTFLELNRIRHFGRTAEALHITQAAVSSRLKNLEDQLGVMLFERSRREMRLTPEGGRLIRHAERLIAAARAARQDVAFGGTSKQLMIGGSLRLWDVLLQSWLHDLRRRYRDMAIIAEAQTPDYLTRQLIDGTLDVAILLEPAQLEILHIREIAEIELICVSSRANLAIDEAIASDYVYVDWGLSHALEHRRAFPDALEARTRVSLAKIGLDYIHALGGSGYFPRRMVDKDLEFGLLHVVADAPVFRRPAYATYPVRSPRLELIEQSLALVHCDACRLTCGLRESTAPGSQRGHADCEPLDMPAPGPALQVDIPVHVAWQDIGYYQPSSLCRCSFGLFRQCGGQIAWIGRMLDVPEQR